MLKKLRKTDEGFTIIEVMIVLAIAGLILLIVFLAVPALQRSSRNTQRKNDANGLLSGINEYTSNNNGSLPTGCGGATTVQWTGTTTSETKVSYYNLGCAASATTPASPASNNVYLVTAPTSSYPTLSATASNDYVLVFEKTTCNGNTPAAGSGRAFATVYQIETGAGSYAQVCVSS